MNWWNIGAAIAEFVLTVGVCLAAILFFFQKFLGPALVKQIGDELKDEFKTAESAISRSMSAMGVKSAHMREVAEIEGLVSEGLLGNYPELELMLESMNPELYAKIMEKLRENPELIHILYERWGPVLERRRGAPGREQPDKKKYPKL